LIFNPLEKVDHISHNLVRPPMVNPVRRQTRSQHGTTRHGTVLHRKVVTEVPVSPSKEKKNSDVNRQMPDPTLAASTTTTTCLARTGEIFLASSEDDEEEELHNDDGKQAPKAMGSDINTLVGTAPTIDDKVFDRKLEQSGVIESILKTQAEIVYCQKNILDRLDAAAREGKDLGAVDSLQLGSGIFKTEMPETVKQKLSSSVKYRFGKMKFLDNDMLDKNKTAIVDFLYKSVGLSMSNDPTQVSRELIRQARLVIGQYRADITAKIKSGALCKSTDHFFS
jgi:translation initiation factor 2 beta subunit (eIF-2beta)/eIF-5